MNETTVCHCAATTTLLSELHLIFSYSDDVVALGCDASVLEKHSVSIFRAEVAVLGSGEFIWDQRKCTISTITS
jgi:hypothetical protein